MDATPLTFTDFCEWRRRRAWTLFRRGWKQVTIAEALGVSKAAVCQWCATVTQGGENALRARRTRGGVGKLTPAEKRLIPDLLWHGAEAYGFRGDVWTCARIVQVIGQEFGVRYHKDHVSRLLQELGWTPQIPLRRAFQRDEAAIAQWRQEQWPALKKRPAANGEPWFLPMNRASTCCRA